MTPSPFAAIAMMVDRGLGVSLAPDVASPITSALCIARLSLPMESEPRRFGVLWKRASVRDRLIRSLVDCALQCGRGEM